MKTDQPLTEAQLVELYHAAEPLCNGDTSDLLDWLRAGNDGADITHYTAQDAADEWNEYTDQAAGK